jgi:hypothetical protein
MRSVLVIAYFRFSINAGEDGVEQGLVVDGELIRDCFVLGYYWSVLWVLLGIFFFGCMKEKHVSIGFDLFWIGLSNRLWGLDEVFFFIRECVFAVCILALLSAVLYFEE